MRTRLGWTISFKSLYFVHPSLELLPLFTGMRERSPSFFFNNDERSFTLRYILYILLTIFLGILPLYAWIGNPFCWACYPLRVCVVLPAGFLYCVLTLAPAMGVAINRLFSVAPQMKDEMGTIAQTIWTFGLFFWGIIFLITFLYRYLCGKCICAICCPCEKKEGGEGKEGSGCLC